MAIFARYPRLVLWIGIAAFVGVMLIIHFFVAPHIVTHYGLRGVFVAIALLAYVGAVLERY